MERFAFLIRQLHRSTRQRVVVLVDEYDKPILDALGEGRHRSGPTATICADCIP